MSNKVLVQTQNFFVDTSKPTIGECRDATFVLPQGLMDCDEDQEMRVTLNAFSMRNNWYRINDNNFAFFLVGYDDVNDAISAARCQLLRGNYQFFHDTNPAEPEAHLDTHPLSATSLGHVLKAAIQAGLKKMTGTKSSSDAFPVDVNWESAGGLYDLKITLGSSFTLFQGGLKLVCFNIPQYTPDPTNIVNIILQTPHYISTDTYKDIGRVETGEKNWFRIADGGNKIEFFFPTGSFPTGKSKYSPQPNDIVSFLALKEAGSTEKVEYMCVIDSFSPESHNRVPAVILRQNFYTLYPLLDINNPLSVDFKHLDPDSSQAIRGTTCHTLNFDKTVTQLRFPTAQGLLSVWLRSSQLILIRQP
jgi:hypothetical protein